MSQEKIEVVADLKNLISGKFDDIMVKVDQFERKLNNVGQGGQKGIMGQVLGANLLTGAINRAGSALYDFGKGAFDAYGKSEQFLVSLTTMFRGNANEAKALDNQLKGFALETPFELTEIRDATKMMIAYGSQAGNVVEEMRMLGDISSGVGSSISEVAYLYGTLRTQGRAFSRDIYQFTGRGIPIVKELAKVFHVTDSEVMKLVEDGKVGFKDVEKAMQSMTGAGGQFNNMMAAQSKTLLGQTSNLSDAWNQLQTSIGESQSGILKSTVAWATDMVTQLKRITEKGNFLSKTQNAIGGYGVQTGMFDGETDERDKRYWNPVTKEYTRDPKRVSKNTYLGAGRYKQTDPAGANYGEVGGEPYSSYFNPEVSAKGQLERFSNDLFTKLGKTKPEEAKVFREELRNLSSSIRRETITGEISPMMGASKQSVIAEALKTLGGLVDLGQSKTAPGASGAADKKPKELDTLAKMNRATQITVNIENLVRELTNNVETPKEALAMNTNEVAKALVAAVNDIYAAEK